jgi:hypothetical protein
MSYSPPAIEAASVLRREADPQGMSAQSNSAVEHSSSRNARGS